MSDRKTRIINIAIVITILLDAILIVSYFRYNVHRIPDCETSRKIDTIFLPSDTMYITDTLYYPKPYPVKVSVTDTLYLPADTMLLRESKMYSDSTYEAHVSGVGVNLDSIRIFNNTVQITKERVVRITETVRKRNKFFWGPSVNLGVNNKGRVQLTVGVSAGINFSK